MAQIRPFRALRPAHGLESRTAALPYDVYNRREARIAAGEDPLSFLNIDRPETQFPEDADMYSDAVYRRAGEMIRERIREGSFIREETPCLYVYELTMNGRSQTGLVACTSVDEYQSGAIRRHENTRREKEEDRVRHIDACNAQSGPIFLAYRARPQISRIIARVKERDPLFDFVSTDDIRHRGWIISSREETDALQDAFAQIDTLYIADGHHRAASAVRVGLMRREQQGIFTGEEEFNFFLSVLFPDDELMIMDYNRVVKDLNGMDTEEFLNALAGVCTVRRTEGPVHPAHKGLCGMYLDGRWYELTLRDDSGPEDPVGRLDVSVLQRTILEPLLGIKDPRSDARIDFAGGIRGLSELERRVQTDCAVAFSMYPTSIEELFEVADAGLLMPPKSTWFEPKLRSGLFIHELEDI